MFISCTNIHNRLKWHQIRKNSSLPQNFSSYETLQQLYNPHIPEFFNFAKDVLDAWETRQKVRDL